MNLSTYILFALKNVLCYNLDSFIMHLFEASGDIGSSHLCLWSNSLHLFQVRVIFSSSLKAQKVLLEDLRPMITIHTSNPTPSTYSIKDDLSWTKIIKIDMNLDDPLTKMNKDELR